VGSHRYEFEFEGAKLLNKIMPIPLLLCVGVAVWQSAMPWFTLMLGFIFFIGHGVLSLCFNLWQKNSEQYSRFIEMHSLIRFLWALIMTGLIVVSIQQSQWGWLILTPTLISLSYFFSQSSFLRY
jgi:hypothetical protein